MLSLLDIPWEHVIFPKIFKRLELRDLFQLRCSSAAFKTCVDSYFTTEIYEINSIQVPRTQMLALLQICENLRSLTLENLDYLTNQVLINCFNKNLKLEKLSLLSCNSITSHALKPAVLKCDQLLTIHIADCDWVSEGFLDFFMEHKETMKYISIKGFPSISEHCLYRLLGQYKAIISFTDSHIYTEPND